MARKSGGGLVAEATWPKDRPSVCVVDGCGKPHRARGLCNGHWQKWNKYGDPLTAKHNPPGVGCIARGYHLKQVDGKLRPEHVRIAELALGKPLPPGVIVHHVNEIKSDNRPENLVICTRPYHNLIHARMRAQKNGRLGK